MTWESLFVVGSPILAYLVGVWTGYDIGHRRGFEKCRQRWLDQILENVDRVVKR